MTFTNLDVIGFLTDSWFIPGFVILFWIVPGVAERIFVHFGRQIDFFWFKIIGEVGFLTTIAFLLATWIMAGLYFRVFGVDLPVVEFEIIFNIKFFQVIFGVLMAILLVWWVYLKKTRVNPIDKPGYGINQDPVYDPVSTKVHYCLIVLVFAQMCLFLADCLQNPI